MLKSTISENMVIFAYFGYFEVFRPIISNKILYSRLLLPETNVLSYISPFYHKFENSSFLTFSTFSDPRARGKIQIGIYKSMYHWGSIIRYAKSPNSPPSPLLQSVVLQHFHISSLFSNLYWLIHMLAKITVL